MLRLHWRNETHLLLCMSKNHQPSSPTLGKSHIAQFLRLPPLSARLPLQSVTLSYIPFAVVSNAGGHPCSDGHCPTSSRRGCWGYCSSALCWHPRLGVLSLPGTACPSGPPTQHRRPHALPEPRHGCGCSPGPDRQLGADAALRSIPVLGVHERACRTKCQCDSYQPGGDLQG